MALIKLAQKNQTKFHVSKFQANILYHQIEKLQLKFDTYFNFNCIWKQLWFNFLVVERVFGMSERLDERTYLLTKIEQLRQQCAIKREKVSETVQE